MKRTSGPSRLPAIRIATSLAVDTDEALAKTIWLQLNAAVAARIAANRASRPDTAHGSAPMTGSLTPGRSWFPASPSGVQRFPTNGPFGRQRRRTRAVAMITWTALKLAVRLPMYSNVAGSRIAANVANAGPRSIDRPSWN